MEENCKSRLSLVVTLRVVGERHCNYVNFSHDNLSTDLFSPFSDGKLGFLFFPSLITWKEYVVNPPCDTVQSNS